MDYTVIPTYNPLLLHTLTYVSTKTVPYPDFKTPFLCPQFMFMGQNKKPYLRSYKLSNNFVKDTKPIFLPKYVCM